MHKPRGPTNRIVAEGITHPDQVTHTEKKKNNRSRCTGRAKGQIHVQWANLAEIIVLSLKRNDESINVSLIREQSIVLGPLGLEQNDVRPQTRVWRSTEGASGIQMLCLLLSVIVTNTGFLLSNPNNTGGGAYGTDTGTVHAHTAFRQFFKQPEKCKRRVSPHSMLHKELQATSETAIQITHQPQQNVTFPYSSRIPSSTTAFLVFICWYSTVCSSDIIMCLYD